MNSTHNQEDYDWPDEEIENSYADNDYNDQSYDCQ